MTMKCQESQEREARKTILGPGEQEDVDRYAKREGVSAQDPINFTLFRQMERKYKNRNVALDLTNVFDTSQLTKSCCTENGSLDIKIKAENISKSFLCERQIENMSAATFEKSQSDIPCCLLKNQFESITLSSYCQLFEPRELHSINSNLFPGKELFCSKIQDRSLLAFSFKLIPGFCIIPNIFSEEEQLSLLNDCFFNAMQHPNLSNLDTHYSLPKENLFERCAVNNASLYVKSKSSHMSDAEVNEDFLRKIRWFTVGYQYEWTSKEYIMHNPNPFPPLLNQVGKEISHVLGHSEYSPEAGVINYYQLKSTLMGHVDRSEKNMDAPLISISLGHSCIFLMGGAGRDDPVYPFLLHSGDVVIFEKECRNNYHGVPRIIENSLPEYLKESAVSSCSPHDKASQRLIKDARININIRQVF